MESYSRGKLGIVACESGKSFAEKVVKELEKIIEKEQKDAKDANGGEKLRIKTKETQFYNTEIKTEIEESIRNKDIYVFQDVENKTNGLSVNDNFLALKTAIDATRRSDAHYVTAVVPAYPYARQDGQETREGITAAMAAAEMENLGVTRVITLDVHNKAITGFFRQAILENLRASKTFMDYITTNIGLDNLVVTGADEGGAKRANHYAKKLGTPLVLCYKEKDYSKKSTITRMRLLGDVKGKKVFVIEDMIDGGGTLENAAELFHNEGAAEIHFAASLCLFNGHALERINRLCSEKKITKVLGTDAVHHGEGFAGKHPWYIEVSVAKYFAKVIYNINKGRSISPLLE